jgi:hypothetical protein
MKLLFGICVSLLCMLRCGHIVLDKWTEGIKGTKGIKVTLTIYECDLWVAKKEGQGNKKVTSLRLAPFAGNKEQVIKALSVP